MHAKSLPANFAFLIDSSNKLTILEIPFLPISYGSIVIIFIKEDVLLANRLIRVKTD